jgi:hypothetical protein
MQKMVDNNPQEFSPMKVEEELLRRFYGGLRSLLRSHLAYKYDQPDITFGQLFRKAREFEAGEMKKDVDVPSKDRSSAGRSNSAGAGKTFKYSSAYPKNANYRLQAKKAEVQVHEDNAEPSEEEPAEEPSEGEEEDDDSREEEHTIGHLVHLLSKAVKMESKSGSGPKKIRGCFNCGEPDHFYRECKQPPRQGNEAGGPVKGNRYPNSKQVIQKNDKKASAGAPKPFQKD